MGKDGVNNDNVLLSGRKRSIFFTKKKNPDGSEGRRIMLCGSLMSVSAENVTSHLKM